MKPETHNGRLEWWVQPNLAKPESWLVWIRVCLAKSWGVGFLDWSGTEATHFCSPNQDCCRVTRTLYEHYTQVSGIDSWFIEMCMWASENIYSLGLVIDLYMLLLPADFTARSVLYPVAKSPIERMLKTLCVTPLETLHNTLFARQVESHLEIASHWKW